MWISGIEKIGDDAGKAYLVASKIVENVEASGQGVVHSLIDGARNLQARAEHNEKAMAAGTTRLPLLREALL